MYPLVLAQELNGVLPVESESGQDREISSKSFVEERSAHDTEDRMQRKRQIFTVSKE